jgi:hypothetical protein
MKVPYNILHQSLNGPQVKHDVLTTGSRGIHKFIISEFRMFSRSKRKASVSAFVVSQDHENRYEQTFKDPGKEVESVLRWRHVDLRPNMISNFTSAKVK